MPPDAETWLLRLALGDLAAARTLLAAGGAPPRSVAYLAQQAAEKALKAIVTLEGRQPPQTDDLVLLLARCPEEADLRKIDIDIVALSDARTAARYPDPEDLPYGDDESVLLVRDATRLVDAVSNHFKARGVGGADLAPA